MVPLIFKKRLFIYLFIGFIVAAVVGTVSHEYGHLLVSKLFGYKSGKIHYDRTTLGANEVRELNKKIVREHADEIYYNRPFPERQLLHELAKKEQFQDIWIRAGGPLETFLVSIIGLVLICFYYQKFRVREALNLRQWIIIFMSLFCLRQVFNLLGALVLDLVKGSTRHRYADEFQLERYLRLPYYTLYIGTGAFALGVLWFVVFKLIPIKQRFTFLVAGLFGGLTGAFLWLCALGPKIMP